MSYWWENVKWFLVTPPPRSRLLFFFSFLTYWFTESPATSPRACFARLHVPSRTLSVCTGPRTTATSCSPSDRLHTYTHTLSPPTLSKPRHRSRSPLEPDEILTPVLVCTLSCRWSVRVCSLISVRMLNSAVSSLGYLALRAPLECLCLYFFYFSPVLNIKASATCLCICVGRVTSFH